MGMGNVALAGMPMPTIAVDVDVADIVERFKERLAIPLIAIDSTGLFNLSESIDTSKLVLPVLPVLPAQSNGSNQSHQSNHKRKWSQTDTVNQLAETFPTTLLQPIAALQEPKRFHLSRGNLRLHVAVFFEAIADIIQESPVGIYRIDAAGNRYDPPNEDPVGNTPTGIRWKTAYEDALEWLHRESDWPFEFPTCCEIINHDTRKMRRMILDLPRFPIARVDGCATKMQRRSMANAGRQAKVIVKLLAKLSGKTIEESDLEALD